MSKSIPLFLVWNRYLPDHWWWDELTGEEQTLPGTSSDKWWINDQEPVHPQEWIVGTKDDIEASYSTVGKYSDEYIYFSLACLLATTALIEPCGIASDYRSVYKLTRWFDHFWTDVSLYCSMLCSYYHISYLKSHQIWKIHILI